MFYIDPVYLLFMLPALGLSIIASLLFQIWSRQYINTPNSTNLTGFDAMQKIIESERFAISYQRTDKKFGDNFDPSNDTLSLSREVASRPTIASIAIVSHELGHVQQHVQGNLLIRIRTIIVPSVNIGTSIGYVLIIIGMLLSIVNLAWVGVILFSLSAIFSLLTLPIEIDASRRAIGFIKRLNLLSNSEIGAAKKVLLAASLTYVASLMTSLLNLAYFAFRVQNISKRN